MLQETMEFPDVMEEESGCSFCCDHHVRQNEVYSFGDSIHDRHDGVMSGSLTTKSTLSVSHRTSRIESS